MFDLFGQAAAVPMPSSGPLRLGCDSKRKAGLGKRIMGVYLSEHPFAQYVKFIDTENTTLPSQINAELDGQNITLVGMVDTVRILSTSKDHKAFSSAMIADDAGSIEVMAFPRVYEDTQELWKDGNFLRIEGKVKVKEERLQVTCDAVEMCKPEFNPKRKAGKRAVRSRRIKRSSGIAPG